MSRNFKNTMLRILHVDREPDNREMLQTLLQAEGYDVTTAGKASEALALARENRFDLYILGVLLPDKSGIELCKEIRTFDDATPVLFVTIRDDLKQQALDAGAQDLIVKPADGSELINRIDRLIGRK